LLKKSPFQTAKFKKQLRVWNKKLAKSGFVDIEGHLVDKTAVISSSNPYRGMLAQEVKAKEAYYRQLTNRVAEGQFDSKKDKDVMKAYISGTSLTDIGLQLGKDRSTIRYIVYKYADRWGIKIWQKKPQTLIK
jgi:hypothetical protein